jgi:hypothetical protein
VENLWIEYFAGTGKADPPSHPSAGMTERKATTKAKPKGKGCAVSAALSDVYSSILTNRVELTAPDFSLSSRCVLCGLRGFARFRGLDKIFGGKGFGLVVVLDSSGPFDFASEALRSE